MAAAFNTRMLILTLLLSKCEMIPFIPVFPAIVATSYQ